MSHTDNPSATRTLEPHLLIEAAAIGMATIIARIGAYASLSPYMKEKYDRLSELHRLGCEASKEAPLSHARALDDDALLAAVQGANPCKDQFKAVVRSVGPYDVDEPRPFLRALAENILWNAAARANVAPLNRDAVLEEAAIEVEDRSTCVVVGVNKQYWTGRDDAAALIRALKGPQ